MSKTDTKHCRKIEAITGIRVDAEPPRDVFRVWGKPEGEDRVRCLYEDDGELYWKKLAENLMEWADDFSDFLRDHRSQDLISLSVETERHDVCSECHCEWETYTEENITYCAGCGREVSS